MAASGAGTRQYDAAGACLASSPAKLKSFKRPLGLHFSPLMPQSLLVPAASAVGAGSTCSRASSHCSAALAGCSGGGGEQQPCRPGGCRWPPPSAGAPHGDHQRLSGRSRHKPPAVDTCMCRFATAGAHQRASHGPGTSPWPFGAQYQGRSRVGETVGLWEKGWGRGPKYSLPCRRYLSL